MISYTTLFFDIDNTLLDFYKAEEMAVKKVLKDFSLPFDDETVKLYSKINKSYWLRFEKGEIKKSDIFENRFKTLLDSINKQGDVPGIAKAYMNNLSEGYFTVEGAVEILEYLKAKGYKLYATTNGTAATQFKRIKNSGLEPFFDKIFVSEEVGHQKPEREYFDYAVANIPEKDRTKILIVGDSQSSDILGGINSGIDTCWYDFENAEQKYPCTYKINNLYELKSVL